MFPERLARTLIMYCSTVRRRRRFRSSRFAPSTSAAAVIGVLLLSLTTAVVDSAGPAAAAYLGSPISQRRVHHAILYRGGALPPGDDDEELDAYIENLIAQVDTTSGEEASESTEDEEAAEHESEQDNAVEDEAKYETTDTENESSKVLVPAEQVDAGVLENTSDDDAKDWDSREEDSSDVEGKVPVAKVDDEIEDDNNENEGSDATKEVQTTEVETPSTTTDDASPVEATSERPNSLNHLSRPRPPNALYRFLLRQGRIGHIIVVSLVLLAEWISMYLPPLAKLLSWLISFILPRPPERRSGMEGDLYMGSSTASIIVGQRTGQSSKQKRALTLQADRVALQQLKRLGNVHEAKYRHVSLDFLRRHKLGPYSAISSVNDDEVDQQELSQQLVTTKITKSEKVMEVDEDEDIDWVVRALTEENPKSKTSMIQPTVSIGIGPKGPSFSVGFEFGGRETDHRRNASIVQAVTSSAEIATRRRKTKKTAPGPRLSDRNGGDGIFGRIRAVAGTDSLLSRSLLGAYPGDAVPPSEAASPEGVTALARKYGWGDWPDDDDENEVEDDDLDNLGDIRKAPVEARRRKKRRRVIDNGTKQRRSKFSVGFGVSDEQHSAPRRQSPRRTATQPDRLLSSLSSTTTIGSSKLSIRRASAHTSAASGFRMNDEESSSTRRRRPIIKPDPPLSKSAILNRNLGSRPSSSSTERVRMVRPALELLNERRHQVQTRRQQSQANKSREEKPN